ncbi:MAG TPA: cytochrome c3 family protein [Rectinemataceae bacterium]|nr:cytochrome c3 family protein [Rectinemataceae bacterium]
MLFNEKTLRNCVIVIAVSASVVMFGYASSDPRSSGGFVFSSGIQSIQVQTTPTTVQEADATSGATTEEEDTAGTVEEPAPSADAVSASTGESAAPAAEASSDAVSGASTEETAVKDSAYCLKCHGPFEKLQKRTKDYVTEWDEKANPHVYVPHDSKTIVDCTECHVPHAIPFKESAGESKPNVNYCYSCHHAETLVNCNTCHKE